MYCTVLLTSKLPNYFTVGHKGLSFQQLPRSSACLFNWLAAMLTSYGSGPLPMHINVLPILECQKHISLPMNHWTTSCLQYRHIQETYSMIPAHLKSYDITFSFHLWLCALQHHLFLACHCRNLKNWSVGTTDSTVPFCYNYLFVTGHLPSASHYSTVTSHSLSFLGTWKYPCSDEGWQKLSTQQH